MRRPFLRSFFLIGMCLFTILGCGTENKADKSNFAVLPSSPIVINAPGRNSSGSKITEPWFSFRLNTNNNTDTEYTIVNLALEITGIDQNGFIVTNKKSFAPSDGVVSIPLGTTTYNCTFTHFGEFAPGVQDSPFILGGDTFVSPSGIPCTREVIFYADGNPSGPQGKSFNYSVKVLPLGWFGSFDHPADRFDTFFRFKTK